MSKPILSFIVERRAVTYKRMTRRGKFVDQKAKDYLDYKEEVSWIAQQAMIKQGIPMMTGMVEIRCIFFLVGGPDGDASNYGKAIEDACNGIVFKDDRQVVRCDFIKLKLPKDSVLADHTLVFIREIDSEEVKDLERQYAEFYQRSVRN